MSVADVQHAITLQDAVDSDYRAAVAAGAAGTPPDTQALRGVLMLAGRSVAQYQADVDRLRLRQQAHEDLEAASTLDVQARDLEGELRGTTAAAESAIAKAQRTYEAAVARATAARDAAVAEWRGRVDDLAGQFHQARAERDRLATGRRELLVGTALPELAAEIADLEAERVEVQARIAHGEQDATPLTAEVARLDDQARTVERQIEAYQAAGSMSQASRIATIAERLNTPSPGSRPSEGYTLGRFRLPAWLGGGVQETNEDLFLSQPSELAAERGRAYARSLRDQAAAVQQQVEAIVQARHESAGHRQRLTEIGRRIEELRQLQGVPENYALT